MPGKAVRRRWHLDLHGIRRHGSKESGFTYRSPDGSAITDERTLARIRRLRIPPAWREVRVARGDGSPLQAVGIDKKGRTQYRYHARFRAQREEEKFQRVVEFGESLPQLRRRVRNDLRGEQLDRDRVLAAIVRLIDQGFFRVGNEKSARSESTYGLTTIRGKHVTVNGPVLLFDYIGKWRKTHKRAVSDREVADIVRALKKLDEKELFAFFEGVKIRDVNDRHVNEYIQSIIGHNFTAKDFRTWAGTLVCACALAKRGCEPGERGALRKRKVVEAIKETAELLGNTAAVCRSSYICPEIIESFEGGKTISKYFNSLNELTAYRGRKLHAAEKSLLNFMKRAASG